MKTPIILITSDKWSQFPAVVFEGDTLIGGAICTDWINQAEYDTMASEMECDFLNDNPAVDQFWAEHMVCRAGNDYYKYDYDGMARYLGNFESIEEALA